MSGPPIGRGPVLAGIAAFGLGAAAVAWVALGGVAAHPLALAMTLAIGTVYVTGTAELWRFQRATQALQSALSGATDPAAFEALPLPLRSAVRRRLDGEPAGLPGPALAPALVGLLVLLGMLGTFLGLVVTLDGTVHALERTSDLAAMRAALAAPVKGLGLAFGTSVAGVAASAMLGLMLALARRERTAAARALDHALATTLRAHTRDGRRGDQLERIAQGLQAQAALLPGVVDQVQGLLARLDARDAGAQQALQTQFGALATSVERSLHESLAEAARVAGRTLQPVAEATMAGIARESAALQARLADAAQAQFDTVAQRHAALAGQVAGTLQTQAAALGTQLAQAHAALRADADARDAQRQAAWTETLQTMSDALDARAQAAAAQGQAAQQAWADALAARTEALQQQLGAQSRETLAEVARLTETAAEAPRAAAAVIAQLREQLSASLQSDRDLMAERGRLAEALAALLDDARRGAEAQQAAVTGLVDGAQALLQHTGETIGRELQAAAQQQAETATRLAGGAVEVASLGEALAAVVQQFGATSAALSDRLAAIEAALDGAAARHDEQLAYYVAQARELIELGASAQQPLLEAVQKLAAPARAAAEADA